MAHGNHRRCNPTDVIFEYEFGRYYGAVRSEPGPFLNSDDGTGLELFYNIAVTPWFQLTPEFQVINGGVANADGAVLFGLRGNRVF